MEDERGKSYQGLADRVDVEAVEGQSGWGWASGRVGRLVGFRSGFPSTKSSLAKIRLGGVPTTNLLLEYLLL